MVGGEGVRAGSGAVGFKRFLEFRGGKRPSGHFDWRSGGRARDVGDVSYSAFLGVFRVEYESL